MLLGGGLGMLLSFPIGDRLAHLSYDLVYLFRGETPVEEAVIVYLDDRSHLELNQPFELPWDRAFHARLLERLTEAGAKVVVFDIVFSTPGPADAVFGQAIQAHSNVVLAGLALPTHEPGLSGLKLDRPINPLRQAAATWGLANLDFDEDRANRRFYPGTIDVPSLAWAAAEIAGAPLTKPPADRLRPRWLNYYGPPGTIPFVGYASALNTNELDREFFRGKVVFIGESPTAGFTGAKREDFANPFPGRTGRFSAGVEVHATAFLNLIRGDWLIRLPPAVEALLLGAVGSAIGVGLVLLRPWIASAVAVAGFLMTAAAAWVCAWHGGVWFSWLAIAAAIIPVTFLVCVVDNSWRWFRDREKLRDSLSKHLPPARVKELLNRADLLKPGVQRQEVSVLFSDIASYSRLSESLEDEDLAKQLNAYYETALTCIHETKGTVVKLAGDSIFAIWNAPELQPDHRELAGRAALRLAEKLDPDDIAQRPITLKTRVGLHTGMACVGNIGSSIRFDYTAVGDSVNLASRLEGLNRYLGTQILATRDLQKTVETAVVTRKIGLFKFKGFGRNIDIYELIEPREPSTAAPPWIEAFERALACFQTRKFDEADREFHRTIDLRQSAEQQHLSPEFREKDGPSVFYLELIAAFRVRPPGPEWIGEVEMDKK